MGSGVGTWARGAIGPTMVQTRGPMPPTNTGHSIDVYMILLNDKVQSNTCMTIRISTSGTIVSDHCESCIQVDNPIITKTTPTSYNGGPRNTFLLHG